MFFGNQKKRLLIYGLKQIAAHPDRCDEILSILDAAFAGRIEAKDARKKIKEMT